MDDRRFDGRLLGKDGEAVTARWYTERGYTVLARNWRCREGELDLVLAKDRTVVICEVKTRTSTRHGTPFEAVGPAKQVRLRRLAARWLREEAPFRPATVRFDVAGVIGRHVEVVESAL
jgi:putative endonuclease